MRTLQTIIFGILITIGVGAIILVGIIIVQVYYNEQKAECISDPLKYAAISYEETYGYPFSGSGSLQIPGGRMSPIFYFNSEGVTINDFYIK